MSIAGRVLLVEDRADWRRQLAKYLQQAEHFLDTAKTCDEALDLLNKASFDVVLVDLRLEDWDDRNQQGMMLLPRIEELGKDYGTQTIVITAYPTPDTVREAFRDHHVLDFIMKQELDPKAFRKIVHDAVIKAYEVRGEGLETA